MNIRPATVDDAKDILDIYRYYVENTAVSFEYDTPTIEEIENRIKKIISKYPYLVAVIDNKIVGYAYANLLKERAAYRHCVETTIYLDPCYKKQGIGRELYNHLTIELGKRNLKNLYACIAVCDVEDEYLNNDSWHFHEGVGFELVGRFHKCGAKFGNEYDIIWMEKIIK